MQTIYANLLKNRSQIVNTLKWLSLPIVLLVLYYQLFVKTDYQQTWSVFSQSLTPNTIFFLILSVLLMPINLGIEAFKWQKLVTRFHQFTFFRSYKSILAGISLSIFTPKRIGDFGGRMLLLKEERQKAIPTLFVSNLSQFIANLILGISCIIVFLNEFALKQAAITGLIASSIMLLTLTLYFYFNLPKFKRLLISIPLFKKFESTISIINLFNNKTLFSILTLSIVKYSVFILQFVLIILAFGISINLFWGFITASCVFFIKTMLPVPASVELAARGSIAIFFFSNFTENDIGILVASIILWVINLAVPALIGSILVSKTKI